MSAWKTVTLGEVAAIERSVIQPEQIKAGTTYVGLEHIESGGVLVKPKAVDPGELASSKFQFTRRHVLYGKLRPYLAKIACPEFSGICSTDILPILPGPKIERRFIFHFLRQPAMVEYATSRAVGVNLPRLSPSVLSRLEVPLPPLAEQRRIAEVLDRAEALRAKRRAALAQLDTLTQALFLDLFGDPVRNERSWQTVQVSKICKLVRGSSPRPQGDPRFFGGPVPRLMVADITRDGWLVTPRIDSLTVEGAKRSRPVPSGTVVMAVSGNVGLVSRLAVDACVHDGFVAFTALEESRCHPGFLLALFHFSKALHEKHKAGAIFINLTTTDIKAMRIPLPPLDLQRNFARGSAAVEKLKTTHRASLAALDALFTALQQRAFSGEL